MTDINERVLNWKAPVRPEWVRRINEEGRCLDIRAIVPLDEDSLVGQAVRNTGLDDFGSDDWREPFRVLIKALDEEAELTLVGRIMTRSDLLMNLEARLRIEDTYKRHPEIEEQHLSRPILIVGSGRSGTSMLQNLLSCDPDNGTPKHWEALFPVPAPEAASYRTDSRIALADARMTQWNRVTPEIESMHEFGGDMPTELIQLEALSFQSNGWLDLYGFVPSFDAYLSRRSYVPAFGYAKRVLKLLQWRNPRRRWILKSPDAMRHLPDAFAVFPDLDLVWTHRDPIKAVASAVSLIGTLFWIRSDRPLSGQAIAQLTSPTGLSTLLDTVIDQIERGLVPGERIHSVHYDRLVTDPLGAVEMLYRGLGIELGSAARAAIEAYVRNNPRESRPAHRYSTGEGERIRAERALFERYQSYFNVKSEA